MRTFVCFATVCFLGVATPAAEPVPVNAPLLVDQLGAPSFLDRENATKELQKLGLKVLPLLDQAAKASPDMEVRGRAAKIAEQIRVDADTAKLTQTTMVKLDYTNVALGTIVAELRAKTGILLALEDTVTSPLRPITLKRAGEVTAWQAVEELCKEANLIENFKYEIPAPKNKGRNDYDYYSPYGPRVEPPPAHEVPISLSDGKYVSMPGSRNTAIRVLGMNGNFPGSRMILGSGQVVINLDVTPMPSVNWLDVLAVNVHKAEDETGRPVMTCQRPQSGGGYNPYSGGWMGGGGMVFWGGDVMYENRRAVSVINPRTVPVILKNDDRSSKSLKTLEGVVLGDAIIRNTPIVTVDNLSNVVNASLGGSLGTSVSVVDFSKQKDGRYRLKLRVEKISQTTFLAMRRGRMNPNMMWGWGGGMVDSNGANGMLKKLKFTDAEGKECKTPNTSGGMTQYDGMKQTEECEFTFPANVVPVKMVMMGDKLVTVEVPFKLENVKLP